MNPMWELALGGHATFVVSGIKGLCSSLCEAHFSLSLSTRKLFETGTSDECFGYCRKHAYFL